MKIVFVAAAICISTIDSVCVRRRPPDQDTVEILAQS